MTLPSNAVDQECSSTSSLDSLAYEKAAFQAPLKDHTLTSSSNHGDHKEGPIYRDPVCKPWSQSTSAIQNVVRRFVVVLSTHAARHPWTYLLGITLLSFGTLAAGFLTNFQIEVDYDVIYAPYNSRPSRHMEWAWYQAGFPQDVRPFTLLIHNHGNNVMDAQAVRQLMEALQTVQNTEGYADVCAESRYVMELPNGTKLEDACNNIGVTRFWNYDQAFFEEQELADRQVMQIISNGTFPDGVPVDYNWILGHYEWTNSTEVYHALLQHSIVWDTANTITYAESMMDTILLPDVESAVAFENAAAENLLQLQKKWKELAEEEDGLYYATYQLEFFATNSYAAEFERAIFKDIPLTFMVAAIMVVFTCVVFFKAHKVQSRSVLGIASVFTITMSVFIGHGVMFIVGIPFTNMTMMLPFVVYGIGLDDTFIVTGAYFRTDPKKDPVDRIIESMEEVGLSISLTTITTMVAFAMGCISSIPAIRWLCIYALTSIGFDFIFQVTLFIACLVIDERRIQANRRDIFCCVKVQEEEDNDLEGSEERVEEAARPTIHHDIMEESDVTLRFMTWYADFLLQPFVRVVVLITFTAYLGFCAYRTTILTQEFVISDFLPADSYVSSYLDVLDKYADEMIPLGIYFRDIDQSDPDVQRQMREYIEDLNSLDFLDTPTFCWVRDFEDNNDAYSDALGFNVSSLSFNEKLNLALSDPRIREVYGADIVRDESGNITASRCWIYMRDVDFAVVQSQVDMLMEQRAVTAAQPLNKGKNDWSAFAFSDLFFLWEFYSVCVKELTYTTISGVISVTVVAFLLMPHWSAVVFVFPMICMLYIDLLGKKCPSTVVCMSDENGYNANTAI